MVGLSLAENEYTLTNQGIADNKVSISGSKYSLADLNARMVLNENDSNRDLSYWRKGYKPSENFGESSSAYNINLKVSGEQFVFSSLQDCGGGIFYYAGCNQVVNPRLYHQFNRVVRSIHNDIVRNVTNDGMVIKRININNFSSEEFYLRFLEQSDGQHKIQLNFVNTDTKAYIKLEAVDGTRWWQTRIVDGRNIMTIKIPPMFRRKRPDLFRDFPDKIVLIEWNNKVYWGRHFEDGDILSSDIFGLDHAAMHDAFYHVEPNRNGLAFDY